jgi:hypothetical protein
MCSSVKIEFGTTLNHVLTRILQKSMEGKHNLPHINLIQNPGFFRIVPVTRKDFTDQKQGQSESHRHQTEKTVCQLDLRQTIDELRGLNLLLDLDKPRLPASELNQFNAEHREIIESKYRNIWKLREGGGYFAAARGTYFYHKKKTTEISHLSQKPPVVWFVLIQRR